MWNKKKWTADNSFAFFVFYRENLSMQMLFKYRETINSAENKNCFIHFFNTFNEVDCIIKKEYSLDVNHFFERYDKRFLILL